MFAFSQQVVTLQRSLELCELICSQVGSVEDREERQRYVNCVKRQLRSMHDEVNETEAACIKQVQTEHEHIYQMFLLHIKCMYAVCPDDTIKEMGMQARCDTVEKLALSCLKAEAEVQRYFIGVRKRMFAISMVVRTL